MGTTMSEDPYRREYIRKLVHPDVNHHHTHALRSCQPFGSENEHVDHEKMNALLRAVLSAHHNSGEMNRPHVVSLDAIEQTLKFQEELRRRNLLHSDLNESAEAMTYEHHVAPSHALIEAALRQATKKRPRYDDENVWDRARHELGESGFEGRDHEYSQVHGLVKKWRVDEPSHHIDPRFHYAHPQH